MYISKITLHNFRSFKGSHQIDFKPGINFFVGNNNSGKTTIFKAIEFIQGAKKKEEWITLGEEDKDVFVELEFTGTDIPTLVENEALKKYQDYVIEDEQVYHLKIQRSSIPGTWTDSKGKEKTLELKNIRVFNPNTQAFENPSGIDSTINALFDTQFVYSDLRNEDYQDFSKQKIVGKLIDSVAATFKESMAFTALNQAHKEAFGEAGELSKSLNNVAERLSTVMTNQYGETGVSFGFELPSVESFIKAGTINLEDNGVKTSVSEKGTGMQRALALALIQVYADSLHSDAEDDKPILFFLDEPETFLHPKAQDKLIDALNKLSNKSQIFITTHSPYLLKKFDKLSNKIIIFSREAERIKVGEELSLLPTSPTWGEINYFAFNVASTEFHNELYGYLQAKSDKYTIENFDTWLNKYGIQSDVKYSKENKNRISIKEYSLPTVIRNIIHHPENTNNSYTDDDLAKSVELLVDVVKKSADVVAQA